jgi:hypothetical protein
VVARDFRDYLARVGELVANQAARHALGGQTRSDIQATHCGDGWINSLEELFNSLTALGDRAHAAPPPPGGPDELDACLRRLYSDLEPFGNLVTRYAGPLPYPDRVALLRRVLRLSSDFSFGLFLPEIIDRTLSPAFRGWRKSWMASRLRVGRQ